MESWTVVPPPRWNRNRPKAAGTCSVAPSLRSRLRRFGDVDRGIRRHRIASARFGSNVGLVERFSVALVARALSAGSWHLPVGRITYFAGARRCTATLRPAIYSTAHLLGLWPDLLAAASRSHHVVHNMIEKAGPSWPSAKARNRAGRSRGTEMVWVER